MVRSLILLAFLASQAASAQEPPAAAGDGPQFAANELVRPQNFREWIYLSSGLGMTYGTPSASGRPPSFTNVYVNPSSYRAFMKTGHWPDKTIFILEIRASASEVSINRAGQVQADLQAIEAAVKDEGRFKGKWGYFNFGPASDLKDKVEALPTTASCYSCHSTKAAVEQTFVQFYPTLLEVAKRLGTLNPSYPSAAP